MEDHASFLFFFFQLCSWLLLLQYGKCCRAPHIWLFGLRGLSKLLHSLSPRMSTGLQEQPIFFQGPPGQILGAVQNQPSCRSSQLPCWFGRNYCCTDRHPQNRQLALNLTCGGIFSRCVGGKGLMIVKSVSPCTGTWAPECETGLTVLTLSDI